MEIQSVLKEELKKIKLSEEELEEIRNLTEKLVEAIYCRIRKRGIDAEVFIGGSLAKGTILRKESYDIDLFARFDKKYGEVEIGKLMRKIFFFFKVPGIRTRKKKIHGSRDYYKVILGKGKKVYFEVVPTTRIGSEEDNRKEFRNITDFSFSHVDYVKKKIEKNPRLAEQIILAKAFCHAQKCYGAESYINGFSGYAIELLVINCRGFANFLKAMAEAKEQIIIDAEKYYKNQREILQEINEAKRKSPIILIDPTMKERNAAAALSWEAFEKLKRAASDFLKNPSTDFFEYKHADADKMKSIAAELHGIFALFKIKTKKQEGDIAGSKLLKFSKLLSKEISKNFDIIEEEFEYLGGKWAESYYVLKRRNEIISEGPSIHYKPAVENFKRMHPIWYIEDGKIKSARATDMTVKQFLKYFKKRNNKTIRLMGITKVKLA